MAKRNILWLGLMIAALGFGFISYQLALPCTVFGFGEATEASQVQANERVPEVIRWKMLINGITRYQLVKRVLPGSLAELEDEGFLFFKPELKNLSWELVGDTLTIRASVMRSGEVAEVSHEFFTPGSIAYNSWITTWREEMWQFIQADRKEGKAALWPNEITKEDVMSGRFSLYIFDKLRAHASSVEEFHQLMWSYDLATLLGVSAHLYSVVHNGRYPVDAAVLFSWIGPRIARGWAAPLTGDLVSVSATLHGDNVAYMPKPDLNGFQLFVPLFGAGTKQAPEGMEITAKEGFHPGKYVYRAAGISSLEDTPLSY